MENLPALRYATQRRPHYHDRCRAVEGQSLIVAGALISIALNTLAFQMAEPLQQWIRARSKLARQLEQRDDQLAELPANVSSHTLSGHVVLVGFGRVGLHIAKALDAQGLPYVMAEQP